MNVSASQYGAASRVASAAPVAPVRAVEAPAELPRVEPVKRSFEDPRAKIRDQVLAERGMDAAAVLKMAPQARIEAEIEIAGEIAKRMGSARMIDIRV